MGSFLPHGDWWILNKNKIVKKEREKSSFGLLYNGTKSREKNATSSPMI